MRTNDRAYLKDLILSAGLIGISIMMFIESLKLRPSQYEPLGPAAVPRGLSIALVLLAIPVLVQGIRKYRNRMPASELTPEKPAVVKPRSVVADEAEPVTTVQRPLLSLLTGITTIFYIIAIQLIGFRISSVVLILFLGSVLYRRERKGRPVPFFATLLMLAVGISLLLYYVFTRVLIVDLP